MIEKNKVTRREALKLLGLGTGGLLLSACAPSAPSTPTAAPNTGAVPTAAPTAAGAPAGTPAVISSSKPIIMATESEVDGLTKAMYTCDVAAELMERRPFEYDRKNATVKVVPATAAALPEILDDGLRYRIKFRDDVYYHDGTKLDAESVAYFVMAQIDKNHPQNGVANWRALGRLNSIKEAKVVDNLTVDFYLHKLNAAQLDWFTDSGYQGVPKKLLQSGFDFGLNEASAGPYKKVEWQKDVRLVLEKFDKFYDPAEGLAPQFILRPIKETAARIAALEAGEVDWIEGVPTEEAARLSKIDGIVVAEQKTLNVWFIHLDMRKKPLDDVRVRQALNYAVDKESLIRDILGGAGEISYSPLSRQFGDFYAGDKVTHYDYNPQKAKDLLAEAGVGSGFEMPIYCPTSRQGQQKPLEMLQFIQANWAAIGVKVEINEMDWSAFEDKRKKGEFPMASRGWTPSSADPDGVILQNFHSSMVPPTQRNVAYLQDPEVDKWIDAALGTTDHAERATAFIEAQKRIVDLAPWVFIDHEIRYEAYRSDLKGYKPHPIGRALCIGYSYKV